MIDKTTLSNIEILIKFLESLKEQGAKKRKRNDKTQDPLKKLLINWDGIKLKLGD
jgi:hypothetical protein